MSRKSGQDHTTSDSSLRSEKQIQDLQQEVSSLKSEISFLKGKLDGLETSLRKIPVSPSNLESTPEQGQMQQSNDATKQKVIPSASPKKETSVQPKSTRCQATTKKGTQCSRAAKPGSNYCWQHGG